MKPSYRIEQWRKDIQYRFPTLSVTDHTIMAIIKYLDEAHVNYVSGAKYCRECGIDVKQCDAEANDGLCIDCARG